MTSSATSLEAGQRVTFRGLRWIVEAPTDHVVTLVGDDRLNRDRRMQVLRDVEPIEPAKLPPLVPRIGEPGWSMREWQALHDAYRLTLVHGWGFLGGVSWGRLVVEPYQLVPLRRLEGLADPRLLIADDTGLGKTAEAGIILTRLLQRRQADRVLILSKAHPDPARWVEELQEKFGLDFTWVADGTDYARLRRRVPSHLNVFATEPRLVVSMTWAAQKHVIDELAKVSKWDVVVIDEAHHVADRGSSAKRLTTLARLVAERAEALLLLTATPHDGKQSSFASLIDLVDPFAIADASEIDPAVVRPLMVRRLKPWVVRADGSRFARRAIEVIAVDDVADDLRTPAERGLARSLRGYAAQLRAAARDLATADERQRAFAVGFLDSLLRKRLSSSIPALAETLEVILRNLDGDAGEASDLEDQERGEGLGGLPEELPDGRRHRALVEELLRRARAIPPRDGAKTRALVRLLDRIVRTGGGKVVVFTEYHDTLDHLEGVLREEGYPDDQVLTFHGGTRDRQRVIDRFRDDPTAMILLATDAASEAVNLQRSCHNLVHVEVPWNPNRYEQRNGRIDRYGQTAIPRIILLVARRTAEERAAEIVLSKLERIAEDVGSVANVAPLDAARSLEDFLTAGLGEEEETDDTGEAGERVGLERAERLDQELAAEGAMLEIVRGERFEEDLLEEITAELERVEATAPGPEQVRSFLDLFLVREGAEHRIEDADEPGIVRLRIPSRLRSLVGGDRIARGTFRRDVAVRESERPAETRAVFLSPGHPLVAAALRDARGWAHRADFASRVGYRLVDDPAGGGVILTYAVRFVDGRGETLEERFEAIQLAVDGSLVATGEVAERALWEAGALPTGMPPDARSALVAITDHWSDLLAAGRMAIEERGDQRRAALIDSQRSLAATAEERLDVWTRAREHRIARSFGGEIAQLQIEDVADPVRRMAQGRRDAERARVAQRARERRDELAALVQLRVESIDEIGALCLLPRRDDR